MAFDISDYDNTQIYITDGWREWYLPKFSMTCEVSGDFVTLYYSDQWKGVSGLRRPLEMDYNNISFGYSSPSSATDACTTIETYINSGFGGTGGTGDVVGPASAVNTNIAVFDGITGKLIADGGTRIVDITTSIATKQDTLVSGSNIKTLNGTTLLGSTDIILRGQINVLFQSVNPGSGTTRYFGYNLKQPSNIAGENKIYFGRACTIKACELYLFAAGTAGSNENISIYIRLNNTTDTLVATVGLATAERPFANFALSIAIAATDYIEMKVVYPTWATPPTTVTAGGYFEII